MKTFTNYAEKKAKQFLNLLQGYTKGIRFTAILILLLMGVSNAWGVSICKTGTTYIYLDRSNMSWDSQQIYFVWRYDNSAYRAQASGIRNTKLTLWYGSTGWDNITHIGYMYGNWGDSNSDTWNNITQWATDCTKSYNGDFDFKSGNYSMISASGSSKNWDISPIYLGNSYTSLNKTITVKAKVSTNGGTSYLDATSPGTLSATSFKFTSSTSCASATTLSSGKITCGYTADTKLTAATATGYSFIGWYNSSGGSQTESTSLSIRPTADATYYAYYQANQYTVTLDASGGTGGTGSVTATYNAAMPSATMPTRNGYTFKGYYDAQSGGTKYYNADGSSAKNWDKTATTTLYAQWELVTYKITYDNLKGATHSNPTTYNINTETITFAAPTTTPTGYTFANWTPESIAKGSTGDVTVTAQWTASTSTVTLNQEEATTQGTTSVTATYGSAMPEITIPSRTGYTFGGYYTETNGGGTQYYKADGTSATTWNLEGAQTLYAKWTIKQYTITYGVVGGANGAIHYDGTEVTTSASATAYYNTSHDFKAVPNPDYKIEGWYSDANGANKIDAEGTNDTYKIASLTADTYVYVKFVEAAEVMSQVNVTATEGGAVTPSGNVAVGNKTSTTFTATPAPGYRFDQWEYSEGIVKKTESNTNEQGSITITTNSDGTLTANFVRVHTVNFFATPITAGSVTAKVDDHDINSGDEFDAGTEITFTATPANNECNFIGWVDGAGNQLPTQSQQYSHTVTDDITIKGIFKINQYTLTFSAGDGGFVSATANNSAIASPATLDYNTSVTLTATPSANCMFLGWYDGNTQKSSSAVYETTLTADKNLEARFKKSTTIFFKPVDYWKEADARLAVYTWGTSVDDKWIEFEDYGCNEDIFTAEIPAGYTGFKIVRLKPASADGYNSDGDGFNWDNKWNETENLTIPTGDKNLYDMNNKTITKLYFTPHDNWKSDGARFAACFMDKNKGNHTWVSMSSSDNIYNCAIPNGTWKYVIFCRMNPSAAANNWNNKWNQTGDIDIPTNGQNHYTITELGDTWDAIKTADWSTLFDDSRWTTYAAPSYKLTIQSIANGTVAVSKVGGGALANNATIKLGDKITITFTPNDDYELSNYLINYASETEADGVYTVCGPTKIIAEFDPITPSRTVYLRPNEDWLRDNPIMAARVRKSSGGNDKWYVMNTTSEDYTGAYSCNIPNDYDQIIFVRLNPKGSNADNDGFNWTNAWNQTKELTIIDKDNDKTNDHKLRFAIGDKIVGGNDNDRYDGKWEENTPIWGMIANFNDWKAEGTVFMGYPGKLNTVPPFTPQHAFKLYNFIYTDGKYFGNAGTMKRENSEQWWTMNVNEQANCQMKLDAKGDYIYQLRFLTVGTELRKQISVTYPAEEMYYLNYVEGNRWSYAISNTSDNTKSDKVSFFVSQGTATIKLTNANKAEKATKTFNIPEAGVYNFTLQHGPIPSISTELEKYTGNYYVRTDASAGGWNAYKQAGNKMTYSSYADKNHNFDHYFCKWVANPEDANGNYTSYTNVKFCVANDYSHAISDEMNGDEYIEKNAVPVGCIPQSANVRFMWNSQTNEVNRAYISGSGEIKDRYLVLSGDEKLTDLNDQNFKVEGLNPNESGFADLGNWIYQLDAKAGKGASISLTATYNDRVQTFFGTSAAAVASEGNNDTYPVRFIYDFKTNNLMAAWLLLETENDVQGGGDGLNANMLLLRKHHDQAQQIQLANTLSKVGTAYGVMTFDKYFLNNYYSDQEGANKDKMLPVNKQKSIYERALYWVSFPFDVCIRDVFGFGEYMDTWIMEYYNGEARAQNGAWVDSESYWTYITDLDYVLKKGVGYVLCLDLDKMDYNSSVWDNTAEVSLYFPSAQPIGTIDANQAVSVKLKELPCSIERDDRKIYDSNWHVIGVPRFINLNIELDHDIQQNEVIYYYDYDPATNKYNTAKSSGQQTFETMKAYMVQFAGTINWWSMANWTPKQIAARRNADAGPEEVSFRLELAQDDLTADKTFIQLQEEGATADFDMNKDLTKIINAGANIYTLAGEQGIKSAGNVMPMSECVVPVGVKVDTEGEYTFRMPDGTEGMVVELIDYYTNTRTNLLPYDYTVNLSAGTCNDRFALHIQPSKSGVTTGIDQINGGSMHHEGVQKYLIDGKLIIRTAEGEVFDAQGHRL